MVMALNTFCLLGISIAQRDLNRANRVGERVQEYYNIDTLGDKYLEEVYYDTSIHGEVEKKLELTENRNLHIKLNKNVYNVELVHQNVQ